MPRFKVRLTCIVNVQSFDSKYESCKKDLDLIQSAVREVRDSKLLQEFLELVLAIGNYMNGSTRRGGAFGFKLGTLSKLADVKSTVSARETLLHYIISVAERDFPHLLELPAQFPSIAPATRLDIDTTSQVRTERTRTTVG